MNLFSKNATAVLVHGAWADGSSWNRVILPLLHEGLKVVCAPIPLTSLSDDAAALNRVLERIDGPVLLDQPKDAALHGRADGSEGPGSPCRSHAASHGAPKGREKLESKADLRARGVESPDRADALIGQSCSGLSPKSIGERRWRTGKESNARCSSIISAQAAVGRTSSGENELCSEPLI